MVVRKLQDVTKQLTTLQVDLEQTIALKTQAEKSRDELATTLREREAEIFGLQEALSRKESVSLLQ
jgi:septal ring factor EnvC (AmiA/AmiB activator)